MSGYQRLKLRIRQLEWKLDHAVAEAMVGNANVAGINLDPTDLVEHCPRIVSPYPVAGQEGDGG